MAKLESRIFEKGTPEEVRHLLVVPHDEPESALIDDYLGDKVLTKIVGEVTLADGYGQHYIRLMRDDGRQDKENADLKAQLAESKNEWRDEFEARERAEKRYGVEWNACALLRTQLADTEADLKDAREAFQTASAWADAHSSSMLVGWEKGSSDYERLRATLEGRET